MAPRQNRRRILVVFYGKRQLSLPKMSDIDDLLNYDENELGLVGDLDANEDDLLLSDEETSPPKSTTTWEPKSPVSSQPSTQTDQAEDREQVDSSTHVIVAPEAEVTTTDDQLEVPPVECQSQKNGEVSSTVETAPIPKEVESQASEEPQSQETSEYPSSETGTATDAGDVIDLDYSYTDGDIEDSDDQGERKNPKTAAEREIMALESEEQHFSHGRPMRGFPRRQRGSPGGRGISGRFPRGPPGFPHFRQSLPNENFNPQTPQIAPDFQFRGAAPDLGPPTSEMSPEFRSPAISAAYRPMQPFMRPPFEHKPGAQPMFGHEGQFRGQGPRGMDFGPRGSRHQFRPFNPNGVRPNFRPNLPRMPPRMDGMRPPFGSQASSSFPTPPRPLQSYPGPQNPMTMTQAPQQGSKMPRKVLINPNFKGGVEAATTQLMMDTLQHPQFINSISSHVSHLHSDEELLRQQEEFINKNRMHIEKRRHERSPERERDRDRDYLSPPRRERRASSRERGRGWRNRRESPDRGDWRRRRRSASPERNKLDDKRDKAPEDEDEETRAYRIMIEKQKAMREKILRDKEMRRRKAAEEKTKVEQPQVAEKKPQEPGPPQKLTPLVVTESKIISLKRKAEAPNPTPVASKQPVNQPPARDPLPDYVEEEEEERTPTPPPPRTHTPPQPPTSSSATPQRRLVLKPSLDGQKMGFAFAADSTEAAAKPKGIFDRLEKKISVTEAAKRKIQRIVINNME